MSRKGDCWDNAVAESFFHTLKVELIHRHKFRTRDEAQRRIFEYVEMYYNRRRAHSTFGNLGPFEHEKKLNKPSTEPGKVKHQKHYIRRAGFGDGFAKMQESDPN